MSRILEKVYCTSPEGQGFQTTDSCTGYVRNLSICFFLSGFPEYCMFHCSSRISGILRSNYAGLFRISRK
jgi:hypothetical protein